MLCTISGAIGSDQHEGAGRHRSGIRGGQRRKHANRFAPAFPPNWLDCRWMRLSVLLFSIPLVAFGPAAFAQNSSTANFDETVKFIDDHLSKVERNQKVG